MMGLGRFGWRVAIVTSAPGFAPPSTFRLYLFEITGVDASHTKACRFHVCPPGRGEDSSRKLTDRTSHS
jgi:hypothetical protein